MKSKQISATRSHRSSVAKKVQRKATTFRFAPVVQKRLELLGKLKKTPLNRLVNVAVAQYVDIGLAEAEADLTNVLGRIRASRQADPNFDSAIGEFIEGEATLAARDPVEGEVVKPKSGRKKAKEGAAQTKVHEVLGV